MEALLLARRSKSGRSCGNTLLRISLAAPGGLDQAEFPMIHLEGPGHTDLLLLKISIPPKAGVTCGNTGM